MSLHYKYVTSPVSHYRQWATCLIADPGIARSSPSQATYWSWNEPRHEKPVFWVFDQVGLKPACSADETSHGLEILAMASRGIILYRQRTTKALIRLHRCSGWSAPLLFVCGINRFSHDEAHIIPTAIIPFCWFKVLMGSCQLLAKVKYVHLVSVNHWTRSKPAQEQSE